MMEPRAIEEITKILIQSQFNFWVEPNDSEITAEQANTREQRAFDYYLGKCKGDKYGVIPIEQVRFHSIIDLQVSHIAQILS